MTGTQFDPAEHPRDNGGRFAARHRPEASVDLGQPEPFSWAAKAESALANYDASAPRTPDDQMPDPDVDDVETMREALAAAIGSGDYDDPNWGTAKTRAQWANKASGALQWIAETPVSEDYDVDTMYEMTESLRQVLARANPKTLGAIRENDHPTALYPHKTADGKPIVEGMVVFTNDMRPGTVNLDRVTSDGWFDVDHPGGGRSLMNAERISTTFRNWGHETEYAEAAYDAELDAAR